MGGKAYLWRDLSLLESYAFLSFHRLMQRAVGDHSNLWCLDIMHEPIPIPSSLAIASLHGFDFSGHSLTLLIVHRSQIFPLRTIYNLMRESENPIKPCTAERVMYNSDIRNIFKSYCFIHFFFEYSLHYHFVWYNVGLRTHTHTYTLTLVIILCSKWYSSGVSHTPFPTLKIFGSNFGDFTDLGHIVCIKWVSK